MTLRKQLLALGALILLLPWAGFRFLQKTEESFRSNHEQLLLAVAATVAREISGSDDLVRQPRPAPGLAEPIYAYTLTGLPPRLDGYRTDWRSS